MNFSRFAGLRNEIQSFSKKDIYKVGVDPIYGLICFLLPKECIILVPSFEFMARGTPATPMSPIDSMSNAPTEIFRLSSLTNVSHAQFVYNSSLSTPDAPVLGLFICTKDGNFRYWPHPLCFPYVFLDSVVPQAAPGIPQEIRSPEEEIDSVSRKKRKIQTETSSSKNCIVTSLSTRPFSSSFYLSTFENRIFRVDCTNCIVPEKILKKQNKIDQIFQNSPVLPDGEINFREIRQNQASVDRSKFSSYFQMITSFFGRSSGASSLEENLRGTKAKEIFDLEWSQIPQEILEEEAEFEKDLKTHSSTSEKLFVLTESTIEIWDVEKRTVDCTLESISDLTEILEEIIIPNHKNMNSRVITPLKLRAEGESLYLLIKIASEKSFQFLILRFQIDFVIGTLKLTDQHEVLNISKSAAPESDVFDVILAPAEIENQPESENALIILNNRVYYLKSPASKPEIMITLKKPVLGATTLFEPQRFCLVTSDHGILLSKKILFSKSAIEQTEGIVIEPPEDEKLGEPIIEDEEEYNFEMEAKKRPQKSKKLTLSPTPMLPNQLKKQVSEENTSNFENQREKLHREFLRAVQTNFSNVPEMDDISSEIIFEMAYFLTDEKPRKLFDWIEDITTPADSENISEHEKKVHNLIFEQLSRKKKRFANFLMFLAKSKIWESRTEEDLKKFDILQMMNKLEFAVALKEKFLDQNFRIIGNFYPRKEWKFSDSEVIKNANILTAIMKVACKDKRKEIFNQELFFSEITKISDFTQVLFEYLSHVLDLNLDPKAESVYKILSLAGKVLIIWCESYVKFRKDISSLYDLNLDSNFKKQVDLNAFYEILPFLRFYFSEILKDPIKTMISPENDLEILRKLGFFMLNFKEEILLSQNQNPKTAEIVSYIQKIIEKLFNNAKLESALELALNFDHKKAIQILDSSKNEELERDQSIIKHMQKHGFQREFFEYLLLDRKEFARARRYWTQYSDVAGDVLKENELKELEVIFQLDLGLFADADQNMEINKRNFELTSIPFDKIIQISKKAQDI